MYWKTSLGPDERQETSHGASGESRVPLLKIPKGALTHHPLAGGGTAFGSSALSEGMRRLRTPSANAALPPGMSVIGCTVDAHFPR